LTLFDFKEYKIYKYIECLDFYYIYFIGDWGLGIGDWGLGIGGLGQNPNPQTPKPKPQTPNPNIVI